MWFVLPVHAVQPLSMDWDIHGQLQQESGRDLVCTGAVLRHSLVLPDLVASEEEDEGPPSAEHQGQWVKPWRSMFPDVCKPPIAGLGPCS